MTCSAIMASPSAKLGANDTVAEALEALLAARLPALPVVDANDRVQGLFGLREAVGLMLPRAARLAKELGELAYVSESLEDLRKRLGAQGASKVRDHMAPHGAVRPETALMEALLLLHRGAPVLPVADDTGRLVGLITAEVAISRLKEST